MAIGLAIEAVPPTSLSGAMTSRNAQRERSAQAAARSSRFWLSRSCMPIATRREDVDRVGAAVEGVLAEVADAVAAEQRDAALLQPRADVVVEPGRGWTRLSQGPCALRRACRPVRTSRMSPLSTRSARGGLGRLEVGDGDRWFGSSHSTPRWRGTSSRTPRETMPSWPMVMALARAPVEVTMVTGSAVVRLALPGEVAQRIEVRVGLAVRRDRQVVGVERDGDAVDDVAGADHQVHGRGGVLAVADGVDRVGDS